MKGGSKAVFTMCKKIIHVGVCKVGNLFLENCCVSKSMADDKYIHVSELQPRNLKVTQR